jgi:hypothetical protein
MTTAGGTGFFGRRSDRSGDAPAHREPEAAVGVATLPEALFPPDAGRRRTGTRAPAGAPANASSPATATREAAAVGAHPEAAPVVEDRGDLLVEEPVGSAPGRHFPS